MGVIARKINADERYICITFDAWGEGTEQEAQEAADIPKYVREAIKRGKFY